MTFRIIVTLVISSIAISAGNEEIRVPLGNLFLNTIKPLSSLHIDRFKNFTELSSEHGFVTEEHTVTTEDGYILTVFRMRGKNCVEFNKSPVLLMHGLFLSADSFLDAGPNAGLAYLLAAECHDLWIGNQRGNSYARKHVSLDPDRNAEFWQFSIDEIGYYDIPATIDYILKSTNKEKLNYIGFSQGVGTFVIMCSERAGYCDKVNVLVALAPATRFYNMKSETFRNVVGSFDKLEKNIYSAGVHEVFARGMPMQGLLEQLCSNPIVPRAICGTTFSLLDSFHPGSIDDETLQLIATHSPAGTSTHTLARYGQSLETDKFQKFNYEKSINIAMYGTDIPPSYNVSAVTVPAAVFYGLSDHVIAPEDVFWLSDRLPNLVELTQIADPRWNHFDMVYSKHCNKLVFPKVNHHLLNTENETCV